MGKTFFYSDGENEYLKFHSAMALVRVWGHCRVETLIEEETESAWILRAEFHDLAANVSISREFKQYKDIVGTSEEALSSGQSKIARKVVELGLPEWLITTCISEAKTAEPLASAQKNGGNMFAHIGEGI